MTTLIEKSILNERLEKSRSGIYSDTSENRRKHRVGQKYGSEKKEEEKPEKTDPNKMSTEQQLEAIDKVIAAVNEGKLTLPQKEIMVLVEKKNNLELAKRQAEKIHSGVKANEEKRNTSKEEEKKAPTSVKIEQKTFRIKDGKISASMYDTQSRISKVTKYAKENGLEVEWLENKKEASGQASETDKEDLRAAREKLGYLQDNEERLIKRDGKEKYEERLKQAKDEVAELKGEKPKEEKKPEVKSKEKFESADASYYDKGDGGVGHYPVPTHTSYSAANLYNRLKNNRHFTFKYGLPEEKIMEKLKDFEGNVKVSEHNNAGTVEIYRIEFQDKNNSEAKSGDKKEPKPDKNKESDKKKAETFEPKKEETKSTPKKEETEESYTRVKFDDVPNSGKVNLKKYLSGRIRKEIDERWKNISKISTKDLKKMENGNINDFNWHFEILTKSKRAEILYSIMKIKGELEKRNKESQKKK